MAYNGHRSLSVTICIINTSCLKRRHAKYLFRKSRNGMKKRFAPGSKVCGGPKSKGKSCVQEAHTSDFALAFHPNSHPKTSPSPRAQGLEYYKAGKAALSPKRQAYLGRPMVFETGREREAAKMKPSRFDQILACDRRAAEHTKRGFFVPFCPNKNGPPPAEGILEGIWSHRLQPASRRRRSFFPLLSYRNSSNDNAITAMPAINP